MSLRCFFKGCEWRPTGWMRSMGVYTHIQCKHCPKKMAYETRPKDWNKKEPFQWKKK